MQKKPPILPIAIVLGVVAVGGTALLLSRGAQPVAPVATTGAEGTQVSAPAPTPVPQMRYIANRDIPPRTVLTSDMLRRTSVSGAMPADAITSLDNVRGMITKKMIRSGDTITSGSFTPPLDRAIPASFSIPSGFRAVAIYVNPQQTAAGLVDVGDRVDVLVTQKLSFDKSPNQFIIGTKEFTAGRTVGTNLLVLAVEESLSAPLPTPTPAAAAPATATPAAPGAPLPADAAPPPGDGAPPETRSGNNTGAKENSKPEGNIRVILAAPLETASRLVAANDSGILHVVVRNPLDGDSERAPEVREYPSRTITVRQPGERASSGEGGGGGGGFQGGGGGSGNGGGGPSFPVPDLPDVTVNQSNPASSMPMPVGIPASGGSDMTAPSESSGFSEPATRDVMVVRGTEKTRVIVPKR